MSLQKEEFYGTVEVCQYRTGLFVQEDGVEKVTSRGKFPFQIRSVRFPSTRSIAFNIFKSESF
jgi:hypothetical protein